MRWILCGKHDAAVHALEFLAARGDEVFAVGVHGDPGEDGWQRSLRRAALRLGVRFEQPRRINEPGFAERLAAFGARALVSIQYDQILRAALLRGIGCPCLNLHFSLLPRHRGAAPIAWAILSGDAESGATLHHMTEAIDAGDVVAQGAVAIGPEDTARELYERVAEAASALFEEAYPFPEALLAARRPQAPERATYRRTGELDFRARPDFARPAAELQRWLRAMIFPPLQLPETACAGRRLAIRRVGGKVGDAGGAPAGTVLACRDGGIEVAAGGGSLRLAELADPERPQVSPAALARSVPVGARLG
jgi:UDP-4-amino-4-deoxy-L-arabinose formyltransferase/UDP-glucuronic acid dehydrogenase (UDP-4-keto-hexauronic acid decarboxylating)